MGKYGKVQISITAIETPVVMNGRDSVLTIRGRMFIRAVFNRVSKVIPQLLWFCIARLCDWLKNLASLPRPIRSKTKTNRDLLARVFPRLERATCVFFEL